jgi:hypothetical protein
MSQNIITQLFIRTDRKPSTSTVGCFVETHWFNLCNNGEPVACFLFRDSPMSYSSHDELLSARIKEVAKMIYGADFKLGFHISNNGYMIRD